MAMKRQKKYTQHYDDDTDYLPMQRVTQVPTKFENTIEAQVQDGDTLQALALRFHCSVADIKRLNKIDKDNEIHARRVVKIPVTVHSVLLETLPAVHKSGNNSPKRPQAIEANGTKNSLEDSILSEKLLVASVNAGGDSINDIILKSTVRSNTFNDDSVDSGVPIPDEIQYLLSLGPKYGLPTTINSTPNSLFKIIAGGEDYIQTIQNIDEKEKALIAYHQGTSSKQSYSLERTGCFFGATICEYERARQHMLKPRFPWFRKKSEDDKSQFSHIKREFSILWDKLTNGEKVFVPLCALNLLVFGLWRVRGLQNVMMTYFCSNPAARVVCWPMFLSTFSHYSLFHIMANMYVLHSFSNAAVLGLGMEQFMAVYLSAGVIASLSSCCVKAITSSAGMSIGASGAIMTILAYVCTQYPETQLSVILVPWVTFSAGSAIKVIMAIDLAGILFKWRVFDHAAHLGGALFGVFWASYGDAVWQKRIKFLRMYHDWRKNSH